MKPQRGKTPRKTPAKNAGKPTDPVEVFCRIRPLGDPDAPTCVKVVNSSTIQLSSGETHHSFKYVFDEYATQKAIFDHMACPLVDDVLQGKNALLFAYGITSSGKTYTMNGTPQDQGILPRCLDVFFNSLGNLQSKKYVFKPDKMNGYEVQSEVDAMMERQRRDILPRMGDRTPGTPREKDTFDFQRHPRVRDTSVVKNVEEDSNYSIFVSYVEIYNNYIYDLLEELPYDPITGYKPPQSKILREDSSHNMYVSQVVEVEVKSTEEAYEVLWKGQKRRKVAHTALNTESSRSHSVFNIRLVQAPLDPLGEEVLQDNDKIVVSQLALVDLAGSERTGRTGNQGDRLREAGNINQSLMVLRTCIEALRENQQNGTNNRMVNYRDSRLTHLCKNYFDGAGKVRMVVCINPKVEEYDETIHVMKFAELTQEVQIARSQQTVRFDVGLAPGRRRQNQQYKEAIAAAAKDGVSVPIPEPLVYSMGPPFPSVEVHKPNDELTLPTLINFLRDREMKRIALLSDYNKRQESFRKRLLDMDREQTAMRENMTEKENLLVDRAAEITRLKQRVRTLEKTNADLQKATSHYKAEKNEMEREIGERDWHIHNAISEKDRLQQDYKAKLVLHKQTYNRHMEQTKKKMKEETAAQLRSKQQKLDMVKNILGQDSDSSTPVRTRARTVNTRLYPARSEPDLASVDSSESGSTPIRNGHVRAMTAAYSQPVNRAVPRTTRARSPPATKPKPAANNRYHRRSKSSHEIWVDHKPVGTVPTGTVLQPQLRKKRSVTKLNEKDITRKNVDKYVLTHQDLDSDGGLATRLVKGDIIPTAGGGASVVFRDVENLKQTSPGDRKRRSPVLHAEDFDGEYSDIESRCHISLEGHASMKRPKTSVV